MTTEVLKIDSKNPQLEHIIKAADALKQGGIVAFPTETVYGLGANFFDTNAINKLYEIKQRPKDKPFSLHISGLHDMQQFKCEIPAFADELIAKYWPGPLTLIFKTADSGKLGFRFPNNKVAQELIRQSNTVVVAPSANLSGHAPSNDAREVLEQFKDKIDIILDAGETQIRRESTVLDFGVSPYRVLRAGAISKDTIAQAELDFWKNKISPTIKKILFVCTGNSCRSPMAEGYLKKRLKQIERDDIQVFSRGIVSPGFAGAAPEASEILKADGIDISGHKATQISVNDIESADLILVMDEFHKEEVLDMAPAKKDRVYLLAEFGLWGGRVQDLPIEIQDPIGRSQTLYKDIFNIIKNSIERLVKILI